MSWVERMRELLGGPGHLRFIIQPLVAILLGIRDGRLDADAGREPYLWALVLRPGERAAAFRSALKSVTWPLVCGVLLDLVLQFYVARSVLLWSALVVGSGLIALPYSLARGLSNRLITLWRGRRRHEQDAL